MRISPDPIVYLQTSEPAGIFMQTWLAGEITEAKAKSALGGGTIGMLAEYVVLHEDGLVHVPEHLSYEEAATLPCAAVTAWHATIESGLKSGESVLLLGTGGVSIFALQFALMAGARGIITSRSDEKLARAKGLGAKDGINYGSVPDWGDRVRKLTEGAGVDLVVEVGGAGTLPQSLRAVRMGGRISLIGVLGGSEGQINPRSITMTSDISVTADFAANVNDKVQVGMNLGEITPRNRKTR